MTSSHNTPKPPVPAPYPQTIPPSTPKAGEWDPPTTGADIGAVDYRADPSHGQTDAHDNPDARADPSAGGRYAGPPPDKTSMNYDLPDELSSYDRMGQQ